MLMKLLFHFAGSVKLVVKYTPKGLSHFFSIAFTVFLTPNTAFSVNNIMLTYNIFKISSQLL